MSETQACEVPIVELAAAVPEILVAKWIDGEYSSHSAPVGKYIHHLLRDLTAERERADRAKAEGIKEGLRRAAEIAYGLAIRSDKVSTATTVRAAILKEIGE